MSAFVPPPIDLAKMQSAWDDWERGDEMPGRTMAHLKTAGFADLIKALIESGWQPTA
jgi:hypothetical protein